MRRPRGRRVPGKLRGRPTVAIVVRDHDDDVATTSTTLCSLFIAILLSPD
jgi:hypothetical protein